jgi:hypothetical protein
MGCNPSVIFRNESQHLSSDMILKAEKFALNRWGDTRAYTYVDPRKVRSSNPGYCFRVAGWEKAGITKRYKLKILAKELSKL